MPGPSNSLSMISNIPCKNLHVHLLKKNLLVLVELHENEVCLLRVFIVYVKGRQSAPIRVLVSSEPLSSPSEDAAWSLVLLVLLAGVPGICPSDKLVDEFWRLHHLSCVWIQLCQEVVQMSGQNSEEIHPRASSEDHVDHQKGPGQVEALDLEEPHDAHVLCWIVLAPDVQQHEHERSVEHDEVEARKRQGCRKQAAPKNIM